MTLLTLVIIALVVIVVLRKKDKKSVRPITLTPTPVPTPTLPCTDQSNACGSGFPPCCPGLVCGSPDEGGNRICEPAPSPSLKSTPNVGGGVVEHPTDRSDTKPSVFEQ